MPPHRPCPKHNLKAEKGLGAQVVEQVFTKQETLSSKAQFYQKKKKKRKKEKES
jgi:hypothetical protein